MSLETTTTVSLSKENIYCLNDLGEQDSHRTSIDDQNKGFYELKKKKDKLQGERNDLCRKEMNLQQSLSSLKEELSKADQTLRSMAGKPILNGRDSVRKVLDMFK